MAAKLMAAALAAATMIVGASAASDAVAQTDEAQLTLVQNNQLSAASQVITSISTSEFTALMSASGISAKEVERTADAITFELSIPDNPGAGTLYTALRDCDLTALPARCQLVQPYGFFKAAGVTLQQLNAFNLTQSRFAMAGLISADEGVLGAKSYLHGGITQTQLLLELGLYFQDVDTLVSAIQPGGLATVSYKPAKTRDNYIQPGEIGLTVTKGVEFKINNVGVDASKFTPDALKALLPY